MDRQQQQAKLQAHNKMHQTAEADKIAAAARAVQIATQHGLDMQAMREKTRLEAEARFAIEVKQLNERHNEAMLRQAENLNAAAERKLNIEKEATHAVTVRAEKLQQERLQQAQLQRLAQKERITSKKANLEQIGGGLKMVTSPSTSRPQPECPNCPNCPQPECPAGGASRSPSRL
jgi:hypothetical protein